MSEAEFEVKLYIYEITRGLARSLSQPLLGRQLDGVWHTGVVVYGQEFYFCGMGIEACPPGGTVSGNPTDIISMGMTQIPFDLFMDHLHELSQSTFRPECYHLFDHNCNTFSNEVSLFLTGKSIPSYITSVPQEVMQTPFGAMIRPFFDSMSVNPGRAGNRMLFNDMETSNTSQTTQNTTTITADQSLPPDVVVYNDKTFLCQCGDLHDLLAATNISRQNLALVDEVYEYVSKARPSTAEWSLGPFHLQVMSSIVVDSQYTLDVREKLLTVLQMALCSDDVINVCKHDVRESLVQFLLKFESIDGQLAAPFARCVCNCVSTKQGAEWFVTLKGVPRQQQDTPGPALFPIVSHHLVLHEDPVVRQIGSQSVSNVLRHVTVSEEMSFDLGVSLIEACRQTTDLTAEWLWFSLSSCVKVNSQLTDLMGAMELVVEDHEVKFPVVRKYTASIRSS